MNEKEDKITRIDTSRKRASIEGTNSSALVFTRGGLVGEEFFDEDGDDGSVLGIRILAGTVDVEIA